MTPALSRVWLSWAAALAVLLGVSGAATMGGGGVPEEQSVSPHSVPAVLPGKVDINTAPAAELERLPGIDGQLSRRIILSRPYRKIDDLVRRKVLGRKQLAGIKEFITVGR